MLLQEAFDTDMKVFLISFSEVLGRCCHIATLGPRISVFVLTLYEQLVLYLSHDSTNCD